MLLNAQRYRFGQHSEKSKYVLSDEAQPSLFNEAEVTQDVLPEPADESVKTAIEAYERKKKRTNEELLKDLPKGEVIHELPEEALYTQSDRRRH